jgi:hypothetical protein
MSHPSKIILMYTAPRAIMYKAANSASVADVITRFIMRVMFNTVIIKKKCLRAGTIMLWLHSRAWPDVPALGMGRSNPSRV